MASSLLIRTRRRTGPNLRALLFSLVTLVFICPLLFFQSINSLLSQSLNAPTPVFTSHLTSKQTSHRAFGPSNHLQSFKSFHTSFRSFVTRNPHDVSNLAAKPIIHPKKLVIHHTRTDRQHYRGEHFVHFSPLCIARQNSPDEEGQKIIKNLVPPHPLLQCTDHARNGTIPQLRCMEFLNEMSRMHRPFEMSSLGSLNTSWPSDLLAIENRTTLFIPLNHLDRNVCHALMRFLFAWDLLRSSRLNAHTDRNYNTNNALYNNDDQNENTFTTVLPDFLDPPLVVIIAPGSLFQKYSTYFSFKNISRHNPREAEFHIGLLHYLFQRWGTHVAVAPSLSIFMSGIYGSVCFRRASLIGSHSNRFAFPDEELGANVLHRNRLPYPLSSDALALRTAIYAPHAPPKRTHKLLYVARKVGFRRSFEPQSEMRIRKLFSNIANEFNFEFAVFNHINKSFFDQVEMFANASVIFGIHGAGLALAVFAPRDSVVIEIKTSDWWVPLFNNLISGGKRHHLIQLDDNMSATDMIGIHRVSQEDLAKIETVVRHEVWLSTQ